MITCDNYFGRMGERAQPVECVLELGKRAGLCEITCVNEDVAGWNGRLGIVGIGDTDDFDGVLERFGEDWFVPVV